MAYSLDFRRKVLSVQKSENLTFKETADRFQIGIASLTRWHRCIEAQPAASRRGKIDKEALLRDVELYPDAYQHERAERFGVCRKAIWSALRKLGISYKKNAASPQSERRRTAYLPRKNKNA